MKKLLIVFLLLLATTALYATARDVFYNKLNGKVYMITPIDIWTSLSKESWIKSNPSKNAVKVVDTSLPPQQMWIVTWEDYPGTIWYVNDLTNPTSLTTTPTVR